MRKFPRFSICVITSCWLIFISIWNKRWTSSNSFSIFNFTFFYFFQSVKSCLVKLFFMKYLQPLILLLNFLRNFIPRKEREAEKETMRKYKMLLMYINYSWEKSAGVNNNKEKKKYIPSISSCWEFNYPFLS